MANGSSRHPVPTTSQRGSVVGLLFLWEEKHFSPSPRPPYAFFTVGTWNIRWQERVTDLQPSLFDVARAILRKIGRSLKSKREREREKERDVVTSYNCLSVNERKRERSGEPSSRIDKSLINHTANRHKFHIAVSFHLVCTFLHLSRVKLNANCPKLENTRFSER